MVEQLASWLTVNFIKKSLAVHFMEMEVDSSRHGHDGWGMGGVTQALLGKIIS